MSREYWPAKLWLKTRDIAKVAAAKAGKPLTRWIHEAVKEKSEREEQERREKDND